MRDSAMPQAAGAAAPDGLQLITARRLVDGTGAAALDWPAVLVDARGRLAYVGPRAGLPADVPVAAHVDLGECTLLPGIIDAHIHLAFDGGPDPVATIQATDDATLYDQMAERAARMLRSGVTTARDCGGRGGLDVVLRDAIAAGQVPGPRLVVAGSPLTIDDGHCHYLGGCTAPDAAQVRLAAQRQIDAGTDWVKMMVSGGRITPGSDATRPQFLRPAVRAAAEVAHASGRRLAAHAHATQSIADAVAAGADSVEHCSWVSLEDSIAYDREVAARMADGGVYACAFLPSRLDEMAARRGADWAARRLEAAAHMQSLGVRFAFGTDCGVPRLPHDDWPRVLRGLERGGFAPLEVIRIATGSAAACIGLDQELGTLVAGKQADLLAVAGDPTQDLACLHRVEWVMQGGRVVRADAPAPAPS